MAVDIFVHPHAINDCEDVGKNTRIWAFAHVMSGASVGCDCNIGGQCFLEDGCLVGRGVTIKNGVSVWRGVTLEDSVFVGPNVVFTNDRLPRSPRSPDIGGRYDNEDWLETTVIAEGATLGANATILCGLTIGRFAFVAAGAVVTADVPDHALVVGSPARFKAHVCRCGQILAGLEKVQCAACGRCYQITNGVVKDDNATGE